MEAGLLDPHYSLFELVSQFLALLLKISDILELLKSLLTLQKTKSVIKNSTHMHISTFTCIKLLYFLNKQPTLHAYRTSTTPLVDQCIT